MGEKRGGYSMYFCYTQYEREPNALHPWKCDVSRRHTLTRAQISSAVR